MQWASVTGKPKGTLKQCLQACLHGSGQEDGDDAFGVGLCPLMKERFKPYCTLLYCHEHGISDGLRQCQP
jgi:hypothetical protein